MIICDIFSPRNKKRNVFVFLAYPADLFVSSSVILSLQVFVFRRIFQWGVTEGVTHAYPAVLVFLYHFENF